MSQTKAQLIDGKGSVDLGALSISGSAADNSVNIDSSSRLLVGTSTGRTLQGINASLQLEGTTYDASSISVVRNSSSNSLDCGVVGLGRSRGSGTTIVVSGDRLGALNFCGADGSDLDSSAAVIEAYVDGTPGANDMPGRLVFSTTADGASSPTERMRINNSGYLKVSNNGSYTDAAATRHDIETNATSDSALFLNATSGSYGSTELTIRCARAATTAYNLASYQSSAGSDNEFNFRGDGNGYCDGSWNGGGADYAEFFEWSDGNPGEEDRRGICVVLDGNQIRPAIEGEDPIGVISGNPSVVGDAAWNKWVGKYLRDDYGSYILDAEGYRQLNPAYDSDQEYVNREDRPEWDCVGLMGKLRIRKGQPTGSRWIKMRDISDSVEEWLVR